MNHAGRSKVQLALFLGQNLIYKMLRLGNNERHQPLPAGANAGEYNILIGHIARSIGHIY